MVGDVFILRDEGACAHAGGVGLADADDAVNLCGGTPVPVQAPAEEVLEEVTNG